MICMHVLLLHWFPDPGPLMDLSNAELYRWVAVTDVKLI
jgi:hypothetical protein